jgi:arylsulfatase A-like enzyme
MSDNGADRERGSTGGLRGTKFTLWDGGIRVPSVFEWPGVVQAGVVTTAVSGMDVFPTVLDIVAGNEYTPQGNHTWQDGISIRGLLTGEADILVDTGKPIPFQYVHPATVCIQRRADHVSYHASYHVS